MLTNEGAAEQRKKKLPTIAKRDNYGRFVRQLAKFLVADQGKKSIELQMGKESAHQWRDLRSTTPLFGYPTVDEAESNLRAWLWNEVKP